MWSGLFPFCVNFRFSSLNPVLLNKLMICFVVCLRFQLPLNSLSSCYPSSFHWFSCSTSLPPPCFVGLCLSKSCTVILTDFEETVAIIVCSGSQNFCFVALYYFIIFFQVLSPTNCELHDSWGHPLLFRSYPQVLVQCHIVII